MDILICCIAVWSLVLGALLGFWYGRLPDPDLDCIDWPIDHPLHRRKNRDR